LKLSFLGAAETVTGSCYLLETTKYKLLVDCGLFQGQDVYQRNFEDFVFRPEEIDFVLLTHAHMDHSGLLPKLIKHGFVGKIFLTPPTAQLSEILLLDAAKIQEINFNRRDMGDGNSTPMDIIYTTFDSLNTISSFVSVNFDESIPLADDLSVKFLKAGHILGAGSLLIETEGKRIMFSGDLGRKDEAIIEPFFMADERKLDVDYVVMESLYGGVTHQRREDASRELIGIVKNTIERSGNVVIPSFAVHKTQELLEIFKYAFEKGELDPEIKVVLDSPLALRATGIYENNTTYFDPVKYDMTNSRLRNLFKFDNLKITRTHKQSLKFGIKNKTVFIAGSGMAEGGRVIRHLINHLPHKNNAVIFVGYQAEGTKGREILEGASEVYLDGKSVKVNAQIERIEGFSSHADNQDLLLWLNNFNQKNIKKVFLTHADPERSEAFYMETKGKGYDPYIPKWKEVVELT